MLDAAGYAELRAEQAAQRGRGTHVQIGIGLAVYVEITSAAAPTIRRGAVCSTDGRMRRLHGHDAVRPGPRHRLGDDRRRSPRHPDGRSRRRARRHRPGARGRAHGGSRSVQVGRPSLVIAADEARRPRPASCAADLLEAAVDDVVLDTDAGAFHVAGTPRRRSAWADVARAADGERARRAQRLRGRRSRRSRSAPTSRSSRSTPRPARSAAAASSPVDDAGTILNPLLVEGQIHGGIAQGAAQALLEEIRYDEDGNPVTSNFADYAVISAAELPSFELVHMETPTPVNPLGAKGIGESGTIGSTPAVHNAVIDALSHLGVRHLDRPATPQRVWHAIEMARQ